MIKILLIDDEYDALEILEWKLKKYVSNISITLCSNPIEALQLIKELKPDIVFLDIQMPDMDGFTFLEKLDSQDFQLIFTTAFEDFALKAFKVNAIDYLLKPVDKIDLLEAIEKAKKNLAIYNLDKKMDTVVENLTQSTATKVNVSADGKVYLLEPKDVVMLQSDKSYTTIYLKCDKTILVSKTLKEIEKKFEVDSFFRVHNSYLVNLNHVKEYFKKPGGELVLTNGLTASVSRTKKAELLERLKLV